MNSGKGILAVQPAVVDKLKKMGHFKNQESLCGKKENHCRVWTDEGGVSVFVSSV